MKKLLPTMIGAVLASGMAAVQADITVFGHLDTSLVSHDADKGFVDTTKMPNAWAATNAAGAFTNIAGGRLGDNIDDVNFVCTTCSIGFKGSEDLGNGLKAIFYLDFQFDGFNRNSSGSITDRDQWLGLAGNFGQIRFGTISTGYKSHGAMIDPLYRTAAQGRTSGMQSFLHSNAGEDGQGRADNTVRWDSPDFNGFKVTAHYTLDSNENDGVNADTTNPLLHEDDDGYGIGAQYSNGGVLVFADWITNDSDDGHNATGDLTAWKVGGKYTLNNFAFMGQYESIEDNICCIAALESGKQDGNQWHVAGSYTMGNNMIYAGYGAGEVNSMFNSPVGLDDSDSTAWTIAGVHKLSKRTSVYAAYNEQSQDNDVIIDTALTGAVAPPLGQGGIVSDPDKTTIAIGMKHKF